MLVDEAATTRSVGGDLEATADAISRAPAPRKPSIRRSTTGRTIAPRRGESGARNLYGLLVDCGVAPLYGNVRQAATSTVRSARTLRSPSCRRRSPGPDGGEPLRRRRPGDRVQQSARSRVDSRRGEVSPAPAQVKNLVQLSDDDERRSRSIRTRSIRGATYAVTIAAGVKDIFGQTSGSRRR